MSSEAKILPAIRRLYDAATDAEKWPAFLQELARSFGAGGAHVMRVQPREHALVGRQAELVAKILATPVWVHHSNRSTRPLIGPLGQLRHDQ